MTSFKKVGGYDDLNIIDKIRTDSLVADNISVNKVFIDISDSSGTLFYWDMCRNDFYYEGNVEFPGTITGTTGKFLYKNIEDVSVNTSWVFDVDYQSTIDISRVVLVNNNLANYPYLTETKSVALFSNSDNYYYWDGNTGVSYPTINVIRGHSYTITISNLTNHPVRLQSASAIDDANLYNDGLTHSDGSSGAAAQNKTTGTWTWVVPLNAPDTLYYRCQLHVAMIGSINVTSNSSNKSVGVTSSTSLYYYWDSNSSSSYPTISVIRGYTYTITIDNLTGHPVRLQSATAIDDTNLYNDGLSHSDGTTGAAAQNKTSGSWTWVVASNAPDTLYYRCQLHNNMIGTINVTDDNSNPLSRTIGLYNGNYYWGTDTSTTYPTITLERGSTYTITLNNLTGHPLRLQTANAIDDTNLYNDGLSHSDGTTGSAAQNKTTGTWTFVVASNAPSTLYYRCQVHSNMIGTINVIDAPSNTGTKTISLQNTTENSYFWDGNTASNNPTISLIRGYTYTISLNNLTGHPLRLQTATAIDNANLYNTGLSHSDGTSGASAQDKSSGSWTFVVASDAPSTLYYRCQNHTNMIGTINISTNSETKTIALRSNSNNYYYWDSDTQTSYPTLTFKRGYTYTINLVDLDGHPIRLQSATAIDNANLYNTGLSHSDGTSGASAQDKTSGTWTFVVPSDAPSTLYYRCQLHVAMIGTINVIDSGIVNNTANYNVVSISGSLIQGPGVASDINGPEKIRGGGSFTKDLHSFMEGSGGIIDSGAFGSHVEGVHNRVSRNASYGHAEGYMTTAGGVAGHSEGYMTNASGVASHSEGYMTNAMGEGSHSMGKETTASGNWSTARGCMGTASGDGSVVDGYNSIASGRASRAAGYQTLASGIGAASYGKYTKAVGDYSLALGCGTQIDTSGGFVCGKYNLTKDNVSFVVGDGNSNADKSDALYVKRIPDGSHNMVINNHLLTGDIYCYRSKMEIGGILIDGDTITADSVNSYSDIRADGGFIGNGLFITDVKGWNFTTDNNFVTNAKTFVIENTSGLPVIDTSMAAIEVEAIKTLYLTYDDENVLLSEKNIANDMVVTNRRSSNIFIKPKKDYGPGTKFVVNFPPHKDANNELLNVQIFSDAPRGIKIGNELINITKDVGASMHVVFDSSTAFNSIIKNDTSNNNTVITYTNDLESVKDYIYITDNSGIIYAVNSSTHVADWSYYAMSDVPLTDGLRARFPGRSEYGLTCDGVSLGRDGTIYAAYSPPSGDFATSGGAIVALNQNGTQKWKRWTNLGTIGGNIAISYSGVSYADGSMNFAPSMFPVIDNSAIYFTPAPGVYRHLDGSGANFSCFDTRTTELVWQYPIGYQNVIRTPPVVNNNGRVFILYTWSESGTNLNNTVLEAIDRIQTNIPANKNISALWTYNQFGKAYTSGSSMSITQVGEIVVCNVNGVTLIEEFIDIFGNTQGRAKWSYSLNNILYQPQSIARDGTIYLCGGFIDNYKLYAIKTSPYNSNSGLLSWESNTSSLVYGGSVIDKDGTVYIGNTTGSILAILNTGVMKWSKIVQSINPNWAPTMSLGGGGTLYAALNSGNFGSANYLIALSTVDGSELWRWTPGNNGLLRDVVRTSNIQGQWPMYGFNYHTKGGADFYGSVQNTTYSADSFLYNNYTSSKTDTIISSVTTSSSGGGNSGSSGGGGGSGSSGGGGGSGSSGGGGGSGY